MPGMTEELLGYRFTAEPAELKSMRDRLDRVLELQEITPEVRADWVLAVNEACMNIMQHGYRQQTGDILLRVLRDGNRFNFELEDQAPAVVPEQIQSRALDEIRPGGLGIHFMRTIMDEVTFMPDASGNGNRLLMQVELQES